MGEDEVLATELELASESANDLDLSRLAFCRNFGSLEDEYEVDGVGEEFDGEWRDLLEVIVSRPDYVPTRLGPSLSSARCRITEARTYGHKRYRCRRRRRLGRRRRRR